MRNLPKCVLMLLSPVLLAGCSQTLPFVVTADALCKDWRHKTISKDDRLTDATAAQIEADNKSRPNWGCSYGKNEAKG